MGDQDSRAGQSYATKAISDYCDQTHVPRDSGLLRAFNGPQTHALPDIMVGISEARFLEILVMLTQPKAVVEVGTLAGFSALAMARALPPEGRIWTIENEPKHASVARANIEAAGYADRIDVVLGDAESALSQLEVEGPFDLVSRCGQRTLMSTNPGLRSISGRAVYCSPTTRTIWPSPRPKRGCSGGAKDA